LGRLHCGSALGSGRRQRTAGKALGKANGDGTFDPLAAKGGSLLQDHAIGMQIGHTPPDPNSSFDFLAEAIPAEANVIGRRRTTPLYGLCIFDSVRVGDCLAIEFEHALYLARVT